MVTVPTVFILGAGASCPYGFPSAKQLYNDICDGLSSENNGFFQRVWESIGHNKDNIISKFRFALYQSDVKSVDTFIESRHEFVKIGKAAIATALLGYEKPEKLTGDWYYYLWNDILEHSVTANKVFFVTFNYDRSLEQYLFKVLQNISGKTDANVALELQKVPIVHIYGKLGDLPWQNSERYIPYNGGQETDNIKLAAKNINIISEHESNSNKQLLDAHELIKNASNICFLGFGFNKANIRRLQIPKDKKIIGTAFDLTDLEIEHAKSLFSVSPTLTNKKCMDFLREEKVYGVNVTQDMDFKEKLKNFEENHNKKIL